eukprot:m.220763 g.220763  ORF g.220763 m.220763 type:complete len:580 (+) comp33329_c0_seq1:213-1952(+)
MVRTILLVAVAIALLQVAVATEEDTTFTSTTVKKVRQLPEGSGGVAFKSSSNDAVPEYADGTGSTPVVVGAVAGLIALVAVFVGLLMRNRTKQTTQPSTIKPQVVIDQNQNQIETPNPTVKKTGKDLECAHVTLRNTWLNSGKADTPTQNKKSGSYDVTVIATPQAAVSAADMKSMLSSRKVTFESDDTELEEVSTPRESSLTNKKSTEWETPDDVRKLRRGDEEAPPTQPRRGMASKLIGMYEKAPVEGITLAETPSGDTETPTDASPKPQETPYRRNPPVYTIAGVDQTPHPEKQKLDKDWYEENDGGLPAINIADDGDMFEDGVRRGSEMVNPKLSRRSAREQSLDFSTEFDFSADFTKTQMTPAQWELQEKEMLAKEAANGGKLYRRAMRKQSVDVNVQDPNGIEVESENEEVFEVNEQMKEVEEVDEEEQEDDELRDLPRPKFLSRRGAREQSENITPMSDFMNQFEYSSAQLAANDRTRPESRFMRLAARRLSIDESDEIDALPEVEPFLDGEGADDEQITLFTKLLRREAQPDEVENDDDAWDLQALMDLAEPDAREFKLMEDMETPLEFKN